MSSGYTKGRKANGKPLHRKGEWAAIAASRQRNAPGVVAYRVICEHGRPRGVCRARHESYRPEVLA